jgi:superfamily II DNA/RNA helicase
MTEENIPAGETLAARAPVRPDSPTFAELGARPETVAALEAVGIVHTFAIQEYALPIALRGSDLIGPPLRLPELGKACCGAQFQ